MGRELLCTLGPSSMNDRVIARLDDLGASLFRVNLSHTKLEDVASTIRFIQKRTSVPICIDSEGAQIRTADIVGGNVRMKEKFERGDSNDTVYHVDGLSLLVDPHNGKLFHREDRV